MLSAVTVCSNILSRLGFSSAVGSPTPTTTRELRNRLAESPTMVNKTDTLTFIGTDAHAARPRILRKQWIDKRILHLCADDADSSVQMALHDGRLYLVINARNPAPDESNGNPNEEIFTLEICEGVLVNARIPEGSRHFVQHNDCKPYLPLITQQVLPEIDCAAFERVSDSWTQLLLAAAYESCAILAPIC